MDQDSERKIDFGYIKSLDHRISDENVNRAITILQANRIETLSQLKDLTHEQLVNQLLLPAAVANALNRQNMLGSFHLIITEQFS